MGLVGADDVAAEDALEQLEVAGLEQVGERVLLVPIDCMVITRPSRNLARLAIERQMIDALVDLEGDGELHRVPPAEDQLEPAQSRRDRAVAVRSTPSPARLQNISAHRSQPGTRGAPEPLRTPVWERTAQLPRT